MPSIKPCILDAFKQQRYERVVKLNPRHVRAQANIATLMRNEKKFMGAKVHFDMAILVCGKQACWAIMSLFKQY